MRYLNQPFQYSRQISRYTEGQNFCELTRWAHFSYASNIVHSRCTGFYIVFIGTVPKERPEQILLGSGLEEAQVILGS